MTAMEQQVVNRILNEINLSVIKEEKDIDNVIKEITCYKGEGVEVRYAAGGVCDFCCTSDHVPANQIVGVKKIHMTRFRQREHNETLTCLFCRQYIAWESQDQCAICHTVKQTVKSILTTHVSQLQ